MGRIVTLLKSLTQRQLLNVVTSRDITSYLQREFQLGNKDEYVAEGILVEMISELLTDLLAAGVKYSDAVVCYHVMVDALDSCG